MLVKTAKTTTIPAVPVTPGQAASVTCPPPRPPQAPPPNPNPSGHPFPNYPPPKVCVCKPYIGPITAGQQPPDACYCV